MGIPCTIKQMIHLSEMFIDEYKALYQKLGFNAGELAQFAKNGLPAADFSDDQRVKAIKEIDQLLKIEKANLDAGSVYLP